MALRSVSDHRFVVPLYPCPPRNYLSGTTFVWYPCTLVCQETICQGPRLCGTLVPLSAKKLFVRDHVCVVPLYPCLPRNYLSRTTFVWYPCTLVYQETICQGPRLCGTLVPLSTKKLFVKDHVCVVPLYPCLPRNYLSRTTFVWYPCTLV